MIAALFLLTGTALSYALGRLLRPWVDLHDGAAPARPDDLEVVVIESTRVEAARVAQEGRPWRALDGAVATLSTDLVRGRHGRAVKQCTRQQNGAELENGNPRTSGVRLRGRAWRSGSGGADGNGASGGAS